MAHYQPEPLSEIPTIENLCSTRGLAEVFYEFGSVHSSVRSFIRNAKSPKWLISFYHFFCIKLDIFQVRTVTESNFSEKVWSGRPRKFKNGPKITFSGLIQKYNPFISTFFLERESSKAFLSYNPKTSRPPIRMQESLGYSISQKVKVWRQKAKKSRTSSTSTHVRSDAK